MKDFPENLRFAMTVSFADSLKDAISGFHGVLPFDEITLVVVSCLYVAHRANGNSDEQIVASISDAVNKNAVYSHVLEKILRRTPKSD